MTTCRRIARFFALPLAFAAAACGAADRGDRGAPELRESVVAHIAGDPGTSRPELAGEHGPRVADATPPPPAAEVTSTPEPPPEEAPLQIFLEPDLEMLGTPPPAAAPQRYRAWRQKARLRVGHSHVDTALTSPDESLILVRSEMEATIRIYDRGSRALVGNYAVDGFRAGEFDRGDVAFWPDRERGPAFVVGNLRGIALYSAANGERLGLLSERPVWGMRWSPDGRFLLCVEADISTQTSRLTIFRRGAGPALEELRSWALEERLDAWALSADNRLFAATYYPSDTVELVDLHTGETLWRVKAPSYSSSVDISPDLSRVAIGGDRLVVMDRADPSVRAEYARFGNNLHEVRFSPSGDAVAASSYDGHLRILSADPRAKALVLLADLRHGGTANVYAATFLRDGSGIVSSSGDETVRVWGR